MPRSERLEERMWFENRIETLKKQVDALRKAKRNAENAAAHPRCRRHPKRRLVCWSCASQKGGENAAKRMTAEARRTRARNASIASWVNRRARAKAAGASGHPKAAT